jgi:hypothetical protein
MSGLSRRITAHTIRAGVQGESLLTNFARNGSAYRTVRQGFWEKTERYNKAKGQTMEKQQENWNWVIGAYEIRYDARFACYDVAKNNGHRLCVRELQNAIAWILEDQGWGKDEIEVAAKAIAETRKATV